MSDRSVLMCFERTDTSLCRISYEDRAGYAISAGRTSGAVRDNDGRPRLHLPRHLMFEVMAYRLQADWLGGLDAEHSA